MGMELEVTSGAIATLLAESAKAAPLECCGLLLGRGNRIEQARLAANVADDPQRRFEIDPAALFAAHRQERAGGPELLGYFHSHPNGHPLPSATDCEHASGDSRVWAIVAQGAVTFWRDGKNGFEALPHRTIPG
ncbi:MAG: M67 family metallopeptidase [Novosphingobium sp.]